ncbi:MAG: hypothetical protein AAGE52_20455 [Myxococcota bacterium]
MQLFSYHLIRAPLTSVATRLLFTAKLRRTPGLRHAECLLPMRMGHAVTRPGRYRWNTLAMFAFWDDETHLDQFLESPPYAIFRRPSWHIRMRFYRRWGSYAGLESATEHEAEPEGRVVAVTLARLRLTETFRFARWGKPVEALVRDHPQLIHGAVAFRPLGTFSTFTVWESERAMLGMVRGAGEVGKEHRNAMVERARRPFHYEFTTMRFVPLSEHGEWPDRPRLTPGD